MHLLLSAEDPLSWAQRQRASSKLRLRSICCVCGLDGDSGCGSRLLRECPNKDASHRVGVRPPHGGHRQIESYALTSDSPSDGSSSWVVPKHECMNPQLAQGVKQLQDQVQQLQAQNAQILEDIQEINARLTRA